jgi:manganese transport protein
MPHNLYLHSSIVQTPRVPTPKAIEAVPLPRWTRWCAWLALLVNAAIMILAASAFSSSGYRKVNDIADATG